MCCKSFKRIISSIEAFVKTTLNFSYGIPAILFLQLIACVSLAFLFFSTRKTATHQYTPVVQRIHINSTNWHGGSVTITAALDQELDDKVHNEHVSGRQYLDFNAERIPQSAQSVCVPTEVFSLTQDSLSQYSTISVTSSGNDFMVDCPAIDEWFRDSTGMFQGIVRVSDLEKGHKFFIENYCEDIYAVRFAIRGENIFTDTDPRNPYIAFHLTCDADVEGGAVSFSYNIGQDSLKTIPYPSPIKIISVFPEPDIITPTVISFDRSFNQIKEHGLYFIAEDLSKSKENQVRSFIDSVLMGVYLSLFIQFLFSLLKNLSKWLNDREQRRKSKEVQ